MCNRLLVRCWYLLYLLDFFVVILRKSDFVLACAGSLWWFEAGWAKGRGWAAGQLPALYVLYLFFSLSLCSLHHSIFLIRFFCWPSMCSSFFSFYANMGVYTSASTSKFTWFNFSLFFTPLSLFFFTTATSVLCRLRDTLLTSCPSWSLGAH